MDMSGLDLIYENMKSWQDRLPNLECISIFLSSNYMIFTLQWYEGFRYVYQAPIEMIEQADLDAFGDMILSEAEKAYKIATIGEE
jgi:hypothetical protein